jgi:F-type H+-transporting ATPase subunit epsilon
VLVRGGFAEIGAERVTVLASRATPLVELSPESIDREIQQAELARDASEDFEARQRADAAIAQLREARAALEF